MQIEEAKKILKGMFYNDNGEKMHYIDFSDSYGDEWGGYTLQEYIEAIETVLNELEKKDKVIDLLADDLRYYEGMQQDQLFCIDTCEGKMCDEEHCKERIKEYFYKKVRNNGIKRK